MPAAQLAQLAAPAEETVPSLQPEQLTEALAAKDPAAHGAQAEVIPGLYWPATQTLHATLPGTVALLPISHSRQEDFPEAT